MTPVFPIYTWWLGPSEELLDFDHHIFGELHFDSSPDVPESMPDSSLGCWRWPKIVLVFFGVPGPNTPIRGYVFGKTLTENWTNNLASNDHFWAKYSLYLMRRYSSPFARNNNTYHIYIPGDSSRDLFISKRWVGHVTTTFEFGSLKPTQ